MAFTPEYLATLPPWLLEQMGITMPEPVVSNYNTSTTEPQTNTAIFDQGGGFNSVDSTNTSTSESQSGLLGDLTNPVADSIDDAVNSLTSIPESISKGWDSLQNDREAFAAEALGYSPGMTGDQHLSNTLANLGLFGRAAANILTKANPFTAIASAIFTGVEVNQANQAFPNVAPMGLFEGFMSFGSSPHSRMEAKNKAELDDMYRYDPANEAYWGPQSLGQDQYNPINDEPLSEQRDPLASNLNFDDFGLDFSNIGLVDSTFSNVMGTHAPLLVRVPDMYHLDHMDSYNASRRVNLILAKQRDDAAKAAAASMAYVNNPQHGVYSDIMDDEGNFGEDSDSSMGFGNDGDTGPGSGPPGSEGQGNI